MLKDRINNIFTRRALLWDLAIKQLKGKYSGSMLGLWWAVLIPVVLAFSINFIFTNVFNVGIEHFTLFVLSAIMPWLFFSNAISEATNSFISNAQVLKQGIFPAEFIPISSVIANFLNFTAGFLFLIPVFVIAKPGILPVLPFLLLVMALQLLFIIGLGILFGVIIVFFRDLSHLLSIGLMVWFWVTPIFYSLSMLGYPYKWICLMNPLTYYTVSYRELLYYGRCPTPQLILTAMSISVIFLTAGYAYFLKTIPNPNIQKYFLKAESKNLKSQKKFRNPQ